MREMRGVLTGGKGRQDEVGEMRLEAGCRANLVQGEATDGGKLHPAIDTIPHLSVLCNCSGENHGKPLDNSTRGIPSFSRYSSEACTDS